MSLAKRIIPCLDVCDGRVVKGIQFVDIKDAGDPIEVAKRYDNEGADEITFLDITASHEGRDTTALMVEKIAEQVFIPLTVGGGIRKAEDVRAMLNAGADKIAVNSAAIFNPKLSMNCLSVLVRNVLLLQLTPSGSLIIHRNGKYILTVGANQPALMLSSGQ